MKSLCRFGVLYVCGKRPLFVAPIFFLHCTSSYVGDDDEREREKAAHRPTRRSPKSISHYSMSEASKKKPVEDGGSNATKLGPPFFLALALGSAGIYLSFIGPNAKRVQRAVFSPDGMTDGEYIDNFTFVCACVGLCGLLDIGIARLFGGGRYFALHTMINSFCIYYAWHDLPLTLSFANPFDSNSCALADTPCANKFAMDLTMGIHLWHSLAYSLKPIDVRPCVNTLSLLPVPISL